MATTIRGDLLTADGVLPDGRYFKDYNGERLYKWVNATSGWDGVSSDAPGSQQQFWSAEQPDASFAEKTVDGFAPQNNPFGLLSSKTSDTMTLSDLLTIASLAAPVAGAAYMGAPAFAGETIPGTYSGASTGAAAGASGAANVAGSAATAGGGGAGSTSAFYDNPYSDIGNVTAPPPNYSIPGVGDVYGKVAGATTLASIIDKVTKSGGNANGITLNDLVRGIPGVVGAIGASQQADAVKELGDKYFGIGAPSRERYEASFKPGFSMADEPGYADALDQTTRAFTNRNSVGTGTGGVGTAGPNAWTQTLDDINSKFAFPALTQYRNQNAATGGFNAFNTAVPQFDFGAIAQQGKVFSDLGGAAGDIFSPPKKLTLADILKMTG